MDLNDHRPEDGHGAAFQHMLDLTASPELTAGTKYVLRSDVLYRVA